MDLDKPSKILIITSGQPSLNPRLVKEADALADAGYAVTVLYAYWNDWGTRYDKLLLSQKKWQATRIGGDPQEAPFIYFISRLLFKFSALAFNKLKLKSFSEVAIARSSFFLLRKAKTYKADLYIGHNLGALAATVKAAKSNKKPCGFDAEDFHRFETSDSPGDNSVILKTFIEDKYIPQISYLSTSSPLISKAYDKLYPGKHPLTLLNVFPADQSVNLPVLKQAGPLKLFWFSQTIGTNRGIEDIVKALKLLKSADFELHLLGFITTEGKHEFTAHLQTQGINIYFHNPVSPDELVSFASAFDIGLATENNVPFNRDICLTNKIFTYMQAGLAIVASDTQAQQRLLEEHPLVGKIYQKQNIKMIAGILSGYSANREMLLTSRKESLNTGRNHLNWEKEATKLINLVKDTLNDK